MREAADKPSLGFHALLAFPEVEAWLLADWERGFGGGYRGIKEALRQHIRTCVLHPLPWPRLEEFGGKLVNGSCEHKLSTRLQAAFHEPGGCRCTPPFLDAVARLPGAPLRYSKKMDGADMLRRIRPDKPEVPPDKPSGASDKAPRPSDKPQSHPTSLPIRPTSAAHRGGLRSGRQDPGLDRAGGDPLPARAPLPER